MERQTLREEIQKLTPEERAELVMDFLPDICEALKANPARMAPMMARCRERMADVAARGSWPAAMAEMMRGAMGGGQ